MSKKIDFSDKESLWKMARSLTEGILGTKKRETLYSILVLVQCARYLFRFVFLKLFQRFSLVIVYFARRVIKRSFCEAEKIAIMRDLGKDPAKTASPFDDIDGPFQKSLAIQRLLDFIQWDSEIESFTFPLLLAFSNNQQIYQWVHERIKEMSSSLPEILAKEGFYGKLVRSMIGVIGYCLQKDKDYDLERAASLGFWFGVLYLYDEVLDLPGLVSTEEKLWLAKRIRSFCSGEPGPAVMKNLSSTLIWLNRAFDNLAIMCPRLDYQPLYTLLGLLAKAQEQEYASEESGTDIVSIYTLISMKSAMTRLVPAALAGWEITERYFQYSLVTGVANQLLDDLRDIPDDLVNCVPTPYIRYLKGEALEHPLKTYFRALETSIYFLMPKSKLKVRLLWSIRLTHALRVLALKSAKYKTIIPLSKGWRRYVDISSLCDKVIVDPEALLAKASAELVSGNLFSVISH